MVAEGHYTVLARRYRPQTFDDVVGQQHVAQSLRNAIASDRVAHAYLFTGARGVGKTSMARILAKALNCPNVSDGNPCNQCAICESISTGSDVDVLEIDGASNRGIDDVRQLRANVNVKSMRTKFKIYIIDEVHMLTKEAFNALLKTLEEPPPNVKFVFCTTEPNKLPDTIISRCQRFDFGTIQSASIRERLQQIAETEGKAVTEEAIDIVARRAGGSMRDSQSLFDQLLAFGADPLTAEDVHRVLGTAEDERLLAIAAALIERAPDAALKEFDAALEAGVQLSELTDQLLHLARDMMVLASGCGSLALASVGETSRGALTELSKRWKLANVLAAMQILSEAKSRMQRASFDRALAELALVRIASLENLEEIGALVRELAAGEAASPSRGPVGPQKKPEPQKKSDEVEQSQAAAGRDDVTPAAAGVPFEAGRVAEIWSQVLSMVNDRIRKHLDGSARPAISGPNQLAVSFPRQYTFNKSYCERPEVASELGRIASRVTGQTITIAFELEADAGGPARETKSPTVTRRVDPSTENAPLVQDAISIFGGTIARVEPLKRPGR